MPGVDGGAARVNLFSAPPDVRLVDGTPFDVLRTYYKDEQADAEEDEMNVAQKRRRKRQDAPWQPDSSVFLNVAAPSGDAALLADQGTVLTASDSSQSSVLILKETRARLLQIQWAAGAGFSLLELAIARPDFNDSTTLSSDTSIGGAERADVLESQE